MKFYPLAKIFGLCLSINLLIACDDQQGLLTNDVEEVHEITFKPMRELTTHNEVDILYPSSDVTLGATLYLPKGAGPFPVILFHFGSGAWQRNSTEIRYETNLYHKMGIALLSYDRRGLGESGGICCDGDIPLLASDVLAGVDALLAHPLIDNSKIGVLGFSQGGWVVPYAAARTTDIAFTLIGSGSAVSMDEEALYSNITGDEECKLSGLSVTEIDDIMAQAVPGGYDPYDDLVMMSKPAYWYYGELDTSNPYRQSIKVLEDIQQNYQKDWQIDLHPNANHEFYIGGGPCEAPSDGEYADTFTPVKQWLTKILELPQQDHYILN